MALDGVVAAGVVDARELVGEKGGRETIAPEEEEQQAGEEEWDGEVADDEEAEETEEDEEDEDEEEEEEEKENAVDVDKTGEVALRGCNGKGNGE